MAGTGTAVRGATQPRGLAARAGRAIRYRCSKRYAYLDVGRTSASTVLVAGTVRSGTTWLAEEVLNHDNRYRMIFEPLNKWRSPSAIPGLTWAKYLDPDDEAAEWRQALAAVMSGRVRGRKIDRDNHKRVALRRIVKCVTATNLLPWLRRWHPRMRTIHIVRHPFAVADSVCRLLAPTGLRSPWLDQVADVDDVIAHAGLLDGPLRDERDALLDLRARCESPFTLSVLRWCLENAVPLRTLEHSALHHVVFYEHLVLDPASELRKLEADLGPGSVPKVDRLRRPSRTDFHQRVDDTRARPGREMELIGRWDRTIPESDLRLGLAMLKALGLDHVYDLHPLPHGATTRR